MDGQQWLASYRDRLAEIRDRAERARDALAALEVTLTSRDGAVSVTVDHAGVLRRLVLSERAEALTRTQLAAAVLATARAAHDEAGHRVAAVMAPLVGDAGVGQATHGRPARQDAR